VFASHDMALPLLRERASSEHRLHIELKFAGSMDALRALSEGRCLVAGFHVPPLTEGAQVFARVLKPLLKPGRHKLIGCMRRVQGLMVARGNPLRLHHLADLADRPVRFIQRQAGSGTRLLAEHLFAQQGLDPARWCGDAATSEDSHVAVAAAIASGVADAGVGIEAAAREFGLGFMPLLEEDYFLVCLADALEHPAVQQLRRALASPWWHAALNELAGYAPSHGGEVLALTQALPWWNFRRRKAHDEPRPATAPRRPLAEPST
jgi:putative molybdopterin biosynthesis protein